MKQATQEREGTVAAEKLWLTIPEACMVLGLGRTKLVELLSAEDGIPSKKIGRRVVIPVDGLRAWASKQPLRRVG